MALLIIFLTLSLPIMFIFLAQNFKRKRSNLNLPPGPKGLPIIGNLHQLDNSNLSHHLWQLSQKHGPLMSLKLGSLNVLVVSSAKIAEHVLKTHDLTFCSRPSFLGQQKLSYNGLDLAFAPYGSYWREMKKLCAVHLFNINRVLSFRPVREFEVSHMLQKISDSAISASSDDDCNSVDLSEAMMSLTSSIICRIAFGKRHEEEEEEEEGIERGRFEGLLADTQTLLMSFFFSDYFPGFGFVDKFTGVISLLEKNFQDFDLFYNQIIQEHLDPSRKKPEQEDVLGVLLELLEDPSSKIELTLDHIKGVLMNIFVGGTDSSVAMVWAMTFLMKNPTSMKKVQDEVRKLVGNKGFVDEDDIQQLPYLKAVIKETMRLQPTLPLLVPRQVSANCILEGYDIKEKTIIYVNAYAIGRDPQIWENPEEFYPERFIGSCIDLKGQDYELIPFGGGRRRCAGMFIALYTIELALANLLYKFDWKMPIGLRSDELDTEAQPGLAMGKKSPLCLIPSKYI
ncbi:cytochrome P450 family 83 subfamily B polypeptide 1 [Euphorbia peplus]|nr:cytochrome P450 family 83 subfamily B polypeptide 1 [Euphorbia peplus]